MPSPLSRVVLIVLLLVTAVPAHPVAAQVVVTPTFSVAQSGAGTNESRWMIIGSDAAVGANGDTLYFWDEVLSFNGKPTRALVSRLYSSGGSKPYDRADVGEEFVRDPKVAARPLGGYVTMWQTSGTTATSDTRMLGRFRDDAGEALGEPIDVGADDVRFGAEEAVAGLPSGAAFAWSVESPNEIRGRLFLGDGRPQSPAFTIGETISRPVAIGIATLPDGGFVVGWTSDAGGFRGGSAGRRFAANGAPLGEPFSFSDASFFARIAASAAGDAVAALGGRGDDNGNAVQELWLRRTTPDGVPLADEIQIASGGTGVSFKGDVAFDPNGNLYVVWADVAHVASPVFARGYDRDGLPIGPPVVIDAANTFLLRALPLPNGNFLNALGQYAAHDLRANVASLCTPGTSVCGDGAADPLCEQCDDGAANSDGVADACRTDCRPARCGDGVVDAGETCDDGNRTSCDGCSRDCVVESGLGCGDGVPYPACGELCDDGNAVDGDGCTTGCELERIPGGGGLTSDCHAEWSVDNAANNPRFDKRGDVSGAQTCTDDDPRCDFDGGVAGSCTFALAVCVNNTNLPACTPEFRLLDWELRKPSPSRALHDAASAAIRAALQSVVPGAVVGPDARDLCSPRALVTVPLKGSPARRKKNKVTLVAKAALYSGATDTDKLKLVCLP